MDKSLRRKIGVGLIGVGVVLYATAGGTEGYGIEIVSGIFAVVGTVTALIKKA